MKKACSHGKEGFDFSCPDVPTSSTDKAIMKDKMISVLMGICFNKDI